MRSIVEVAREHVPGVGVVGMLRSSANKGGSGRVKEATRIQAVHIEVDRLGEERDVEGLAPYKEVVASGPV
jgi:hypothetical protein